MQTDLTSASLEEFARFWFDHDIDPRAVGPHAYASDCANFSAPQLGQPNLRFSR